jgi:group I intron endonuclease
MTSLRTWYIYCITCLHNGKRYIGQTVTTPKKRWYAHTYLALVRRRCSRFYEAIRKYGKEGFRLDVLVSHQQGYDVSDQLEIAFIKQFDTMNPDKGYNMTTGGNQRSLTKLSPEACEKISLAKHGKKLGMRTTTLDRSKLIVEAFKQGLTRKEIAEKLSLTPAIVVKALNNWAREVDPTLEVGKKYQYKQSGKRLRDRARPRRQAIIDLFLQNVSRLEIMERLHESRGYVKTTINHYKRTGIV